VAQSPASLGFHLPAEGEPHEATWIAWPHNVTDWPGRFAPIPWVYSEFVRKIAPGEIVRIIVESESHQERARRVLSRAGVDLSRVEFFRFPTDRGWTRDSGPIFLKRPLPSPALASPVAGAAAARPASEVAIIRFRFNAWAKYPEWRHDDAIPERAAQALNLPLLPARAGDRDLVLEGGSIDVNGRGTLLSTEECLLDANVQARNPGLSRQDIEAALRDNLGVRNILWLGRGIAGDDTHGHVDDLCRFVNPRTVVLCREDNPTDPNYQLLEENRERLEGMRLEDGSRIEVVPLPMPSPLYFDGQRLPASYANFYISNAAVLVPTFNDPKDRIALGSLAELFTDRPVVGIHAVDLVWGLGTIHCLTQQQPALP
jgi:agmatine deiminase